jgi:hypothetical protein
MSTDAYQLALKTARRRASLETGEQLTRLDRDDIAAVLMAPLDRNPIIDPPLPSAELLRSQAIAARSALRRHGIFVCFLGANAPARIRPPVDDGAA